MNPDPYDFIEVGKKFTEKHTDRAKMLFVDDRMKRIDYALRNFPEYEVSIAPNVPEALRAMSGQDWDVISLDHDLNGYDFQDPDTPTCGMEIVRYIEKTGWPTQRKKPEFWIHSSNLFAAHLMVVKLIRLGFNVWHKPIYYKVEHMKYDSTGLPIL
jgi:CheY-like chemotaxis protein